MTKVNLCVPVIGILCLITIETSMYSFYMTQSPRGKLSWCPTLIERILNLLQWVNCDRYHEEPINSMKCFTLPGFCRGSGGLWFQNMYILLLQFWNDNSNLNKDNIYHFFAIEFLEFAMLPQNTAKKALPKKSSFTIYMFERG